MNMPTVEVAIVGLAVVWLGIAAAIAFVAARRARLAQAVLDAARSGAALLETAPARPLLVRTDGRIEADAQLLRDLGLPADRARLAELTGNDSGLIEEDLAELVSEIETARVSAGRVTRKVRAQGSGRVFEVRGGPARPLHPP